MLEKSGKNSNMHNFLPNIWNNGLLGNGKKILFIEFSLRDISYFRGFPFVTQLSRFKCNIRVIQKYSIVVLSAKYGISMKYIFIDLLTTGKIVTRFQSQFVRKRDWSKKEIVQFFLKKNGIWNIEIGFLAFFYGIWYRCGVHVLSSRYRHMGYFAKAEVRNFLPK